MQKVVTIQYCKNCKHHSWNTRHDQSRYANCFTEFKNKLAKSGIEVKATQGYRLGAFQIFIDNYQIFSKIKTNVFPDVDAVGKFIGQFFEQIEEKKEKYSNLLQSANQMNKNKGRRVTLSPGFARVSKFSSPNKIANNYFQIFNAEKQLKNSKINNKIIATNQSNISVEKKRSIQRMRNSGISQGNHSMSSNPENYYG